MWEKPPDTYKDTYDYVCGGSSSRRLADEWVVSDFEDDDDDKAGSPTGEEVVSDFEDNDEAGSDSAACKVNLDMTSVDNCAVLCGEFFAFSWAAIGEDLSNPDVNVCRCYNVTPVDPDKPASDGTSSGVMCIRQSSVTLDIYPKGIATDTIPS